MSNNKFGSTNVNKDKDKEKEKDNASNQPKIWNDSEVKLLKKWAELSASYRVLHDRAHRIYKFRNYCFTIPVIIFSTILGTASFSQSTFPVSYQHYIPMGIGTLNIISGIITTIAQFTRVSELSEANRVASIAYGKFSRNIATELSLPPEFRTYSGIDFVQICRSEFDRLLEQSPIIPLDILEKFMSELDDDIEKPDIMKVTKIEEWKPTKEEKAAKIIANAFQTMHNRSREKEKSGVQKMADMVQKKGYGVVNKISSMITPPAIKELKEIKAKEEEILNNNIGAVKEQILEKKNSFTGFVAKQVESRANELKEITGSVNVSNLIKKKNEELNQVSIPTPTPTSNKISPNKIINSALNTPQKNDVVNSVKSNVFNIIQKAKNELQQPISYVGATNNYDEVPTNIDIEEKEIVVGTDENV